MSSFPRKREPSAFARTGPESGKSLGSRFRGNDDQGRSSKSRTRVPNPRPNSTLPTPPTTTPTHTPTHSPHHTPQAHTPHPTHTTLPPPTSTNYPHTDPNVATPRQQVIIAIYHTY